jgi:hypothetical protein
VGGKSDNTGNKPTWVSLCSTSGKDVTRFLKQQVELKASFPQSAHSDRGRSEANGQRFTRF